MSPDVNGLPPPASPSFGRRSQTHSRRTSQMAARDEEGLPMRHPRPLTAAELHLELEQEQEAVVNRLTRELSALRAQHSASAASNASSTTSTSAILETPASSTHPTTSSSPARHRSSSSLSTRSHTGSQPLHPQSAAGLSSQASVERARDAAGMRSRENSLASGTGVGSGGVTMPAPSRSRAPSASPSPSMHFGDAAYFGSSGRDGISGRDGRQRRGSNASISTGRYDDSERMRVQLEQARRENEMLAVRVRELEGLLKESELKSRGRSGRGEGEEKG